MRPRREHVYCGLCHVFNAIPLWGLLFCGWVWFTMREESRFVVYHARQAMTFHVLLMLALLIYAALELVSRVMGVLLPSFGGVLRQANDIILKVLLIAYVVICVEGGLQCLIGRRFHYPLLGRRGAP